MKIIFAESKYWKDVKEQEVVKAQVKKETEQAYSSAKKELPVISQHVNFIIRPIEYYIPETGDHGWAFDAEIIFLGFDPKMPHGLEKIKKQLRSTVFHELAHTARYITADRYDITPLQKAVGEGLACVFERENANGYQPWAEYQPTNRKELLRWYQELKSAGDTQEEWGNLAYKHPDGRRWVAYKTGTWIVDEAIKKSGKGVSDLIGLNAAAVVKLSRVGRT